MNKLEEFWYCVAPQEDLPLCKNANEINVASCDRLTNLIKEYKRLQGSDIVENIIRKIILDNPKVISDMRMLVAVSNKRLYLDLTYIANIYKDEKNTRLVPEARENLLKHNTNYFVKLLSKSDKKRAFAKEVALYFMSKGLIGILNTFSLLNEQQIKSIFKNLVVPKEIQQMQAKYRGHGAEQAFAQIITACGLSVIPENKALDPMSSQDPNVDLSTMTELANEDTRNEHCYSFDLIIKDSDSKIRVLIQSLIHSSDPGQYGVNKSNDTPVIHKKIQSYNQQSDQQVYLLGSVDGVGFCENPTKTIAKMLDVFDDFFQIHTLFKIPVFLQKIGMINHVKGIVFDKSYFEDYAIEHFVDTYLNPLGIKNMTDEDISNFETVKAGKAIVVFD